MERSTVVQSRTLEEAAPTLEIDGDGVAFFTFDDAGRRVNVLTHAMLTRLAALVDVIQGEVRAGRVRGVVIRSGKPGTFIAGADIDEIARVDDPADGTAKARMGQQVFQRLHGLPVSTVAAIDGTCLGGGTELALACTTRVASDRPETRIGLPEVRLGIIPGFGGTVRLPRLVGLRAAAQMILTGKTVTVRRAQRVGLIDERVPSAVLDERARQLALEPAGASGERRARRRGLLARLLEEAAPGRSVILWQARRRVLRETAGHYPAPLTAIEVLGATATLPLEQALEREAEAVGPLVVGDVCKNLIHVFRLLEGAKKAGPAGLTTRPATQAAVLGAGTMGGGIAQLLAYKALPVRLKDIRAEAISLGLRHARGLFERQVRRGRLERRQAEQGMARIAPTLDYSGFGRADIVIEAVVERLDVKRQVLREIEERVPPECVLASNTSALSISELQHALERPEKLCGMHFFNPVHRMPLVELVRGTATSEETLATVFALTLRLDKTPLIVNDGPGFLVNRLLAPYMNEAGWLLADGASVEAIDGALISFGMPMGPLRVLDEVGLDVSRHVAEVLYEAFGDRMRPAPPLAALERTDRLGRKGGLGFYRYEAGEEKGVDPAIYTALGDSIAAERREISPDVVQDRAVLAMINEAARVLEDGVVDGPGDVDLGIITGAGFPPFRGGLLRYADTLGTDTVLARLDRYERELGPRFHPARLLQERVAEGRGFYG